MNVVKLRITLTDGRFKYNAEAIGHCGKYYYHVGDKTIEISKTEYGCVIANPRLYYFSTALKLHNAIEKGLRKMVQLSESSALETGLRRCRQPIKTERFETKPRLLRIQLDYEDGSRDDIEVLPNGSSAMPLYGWRRQRPDETLAKGAYTRQAIAALLFYTGLQRCLVNYDATDAKIRDLVQQFGVGD